MLSLLSFGENGWGTLILSATLTTLLLSLAALAVGAVVGGMIAAAKLSPHAPVRWFGSAYSVVFRGIPELLVIYLFYFGGSGLVSAIGQLFGADGFIEVPPFLIGSLAIGLISASYQAEVYRAARLALMPGEVEAASAIGMPRWRIFQRIMLPQIARYSLPGLSNVWQMSLKDSALVSVTGIAELMRASQIAAGSTREYFLFYVIGGGCYLILTLVSNRAFIRAELPESRLAAPYRGSGLRRIYVYRRCLLSDTFLKLCAALPVTLGLFICSFLCGGVLAVGVLALRMSRWPLLSGVAKGYILVFRGSPLLIQLFLIYYGLGQFGVIRHSFLWPLLREPFICAVLALALCTAAYTAEILRGALLAVPSGQIEAGQACGMSRFLLLRRIIAPVMLRYALPAYSTEAILLVKSTALASLVTVWDVTGVAQQIIQRTYRTMEVFLCAAVIYLLLNFIIVQLYALLERRLTPHTRQTPATVALKPAAKGE
jgi:octopine/nopaline transport system permease protein